jgi:membrane protein
VTEVVSRDGRRQHAQRLAEEIKAAYRRLDRLGGGSLGILVQAVREFNQARAPQAAASIAYYAIFSLFPLLLVLIALGSIVIQTQRVESAVLNYLTSALPFSQPLIQRNLEEVLRRRQTLGIIGAVGLTWAASGVFSTLAHNINSAWKEAPTRAFLETRLVGMGMVFILVLLVVLSFLGSTVLDLLARLGVPFVSSVAAYGTTFLGLLSSVIPGLFTFVMLLSLYRWVPNTQVKWSAAIGGSLVASILWELIQEGFALFLSSSLFNLQLVYGSLATIIILLLWIYIAGLIVLFGAHLSAAIAHRGQE